MTGCLPWYDTPGPRPPPAPGPSPGTGMWNNAGPRGSTGRPYDGSYCRSVELYISINGLLSVVCIKCWITQGQ